MAAKPDLGFLSLSYYCHVLLMQLYIAIESVLCPDESFPPRISKSDDDRRSVANLVLGIGKGESSSQEF
jgi:hypothetical protein